VSESQYRLKCTVGDAYLGILAALGWWLCMGVATFGLLAAVADPSATPGARLLGLVIYFGLTAIALGLRYGMQYPERAAP